MDNKNKVLIAGIGGASLGTEILKSLNLSNKYLVYGGDISPLAFGHYQSGFRQTFIVNRDAYVDSIIDICLRHQINNIIPGGEEPMVLLGQCVDILNEKNITLIGNSGEVIATCSDKIRCFETLSMLNIPVPKTVAITDCDQLDDMPFPCIVKPATGTGGSSYVFLSKDKEEALVYVDYLIRNGKTPLVQEYIDEESGEFTVGVLSLPDGTLVSSIALKRLFHSKLSVLTKGQTGLISSGYSQGLIDDFPEIRKQCEKIATDLNSRGPLNIQGRMADGCFIPFEINPRFSASTYLRAMAGFNEIDILLEYVISGEILYPEHIEYGYYLRSLSETFVSKETVRK